MALIYLKDVCADVRLGLWRMDEEPEELYACYPHLRQLEMPYKSISRQKEFLCIRALLMKMTGDATLTIGHEDSGQPVLISKATSSSPSSSHASLTSDPYPINDGNAAVAPSATTIHLSISHTKGYAVLMLSPSQPVGVDIEYRSDRIRKIASHFISPDEMRDFFQRPAQYEAVTMKMLALWCAKETLYKLHSEDNLQYFDMRMQALQMPDYDQPRCQEQPRECTASIDIDNVKRRLRVKVHVVFTPDYCLTWAVGNS